MTVLWSYFWPLMAVGLGIGAATAWIALRPRHAARSDAGRRRTLVFTAGAAATLAITALWYGPFGAADQLASQVEAGARAEIERLEMAQVSARLERGPLRRRLVLSGRANDFQQRELARLLDELPGVSGVRWTSPPDRSPGGLK